MITFVIDSLRDVINAFNPEDCEVFTNFCIVALENNSHTSGCILKVSGDQEKQFRLEWSKQFKKARYVDEIEITKNAAETISFFLTKELTPYSILKQSALGTGFDYWIGYDKQDKRYNPRNFIQARLEISGIDEEKGSNNLGSRVEIKERQTDKSDSTGYPAYISTVEFNTPKAIFKRK